MKRYAVRMTEKALLDVEAVLAWFREQTAERAGAKWLGQLLATINKLERAPGRCRLAAESAEVGRQVRELLVGKRPGAYRVLFEIAGQVVYILRVWHGARDAVTTDDL